MARRVTHRVIAFIASASSFMLVGAMLVFWAITKLDGEYEWDEE